MTMESDPKTSDTKSNTNSDPISNPKVDDAKQRLVKKKSQKIETPFVAHSANMSAKSEEAGGQIEFTPHFYAQSLMALERPN